MKHIIAFLSFLCIFTYGAPSQEIPAITQEAKALFHIESFRMQNKAGRFYTIYIAKPKQKIDSTSIFYTLDGNAFFPMLLNTIAIDKAADSIHALPIIVSIAHDSTLAFDRELRTYDYTPILDKHLQDEFSGGCGIDTFLDFLIHQVKPTIHKRFGTPSKELLFGHSFGGLFVLHTMSSVNAAFTHYVCASPSLWWGNGAFIESYKTLVAKNAPLKSHIIFTRGSLEKEGQNKHKTPNAKKPLYDIQSVVKIYQKAAINPKNVVFVEITNKTHGGSIPGAFMLGLESFMGR